MEPDDELDDEPDAEPDDRQVLSASGERENEEPEESKEEDQYDVVIFHTDDQTGLAERLRDQLLDIQLDNGRQLVVEILDGAMELGVQDITNFNRIIKGATLLLYYREERLFENSRLDFAVNAALSNTIRKQSWTLWPVSVGPQTTDNPMHESLTGLNVDNNGNLKPKALDKIRKHIVKLLPSPSAAPRSSVDSQIRGLVSFQNDHFAAAAPQVSSIASSVTVTTTRSHGNEPFDYRTGTPLPCAGPSSHSTVPPAGNSSSFTVLHAAATRSSPLPQSVEIDAASPQEDQEQYQLQRSHQRHQQQQSIQQQYLRPKWDDQGARPKMTNSAAKASSDQTDTSTPPTVSASTACPADGDTHNTVSQRHNSARPAGPASLPQQSQDAIVYHHLQESREGIGHAQSRQSIQSTDFSENVDSDRTELKTLATETESTSSTADFAANNEQRDADREQRTSMGKGQSSDPELDLLDMLRQTALTTPPASLVAYNEIRSLERYHNAPVSACPTDGDISVSRENTDDY